jgi:hypothetical protein
MIDKYNLDLKTEPAIDCSSPVNIYNEQAFPIILNRDMPDLNEMYLLQSQLK